MTPDRLGIANIRYQAQPPLLVHHFAQRGNYRKVDSCSTSCG